MMTMAKMKRLEPRLSQRQCDNCKRTGASWAIMDWHEKPEMPLKPDGDHYGWPLYVFDDGCLCQKCAREAHGVQAQAELF